LGWRLKHKEELYELNRLEEVENINFNRWELSGLIVRIDYTRILKQVPNGEFMKYALLQEQVVMERIYEYGRGCHSTETSGNKLVKRPELVEGLRVMEKK
jgi:hypothetical protein